MLGEDAVLASDEGVEEAHGEVGEGRRAERDVGGWDRGGRG